MKYYFNEAVAKDIGVEEAIMFSNIEWWVRANKENERKRSFKDGYYWTYNSVKAFCKLFPFWSESQIKRILKNLESSGYIISGNYNKAKYDRTKWYRPVRIIDSSKSANRTEQTDQPIPDSKQDKENKDIVNHIETADNKEISSLIYLFKDVNPSYKQLFQRKAEQNAIKRLLEKYNYKQLSEMISLLKDIIGKKYAPVITSPYQLENKLGYLIAYISREKQGNNTVAFL